MEKFDLGALVAARKQEKNEALTSDQEHLVAMAGRAREIQVALLRGVQQLTPILIMDRGDGSPLAVAEVGELFKEGIESEQRSAAIIELLNRLDAKAFVMATEAWMVSLPANGMEKVEDVELERPIREDDRRVSSLVLNGRGAKGDALVAIFKIKEGGEVRELEAEPMHLDVGPDVVMGGALGGVRRESVQ